MIEGCKHGPAYEIPQPCEACAEEREAERKRLRQIERRIGDLVYRDFEKQQIAPLPKTDAHVIAYATNRCLRCDAEFFPDGGWRGIDCHKVRRAEEKT